MKKILTTILLAFALQAAIAQLQQGQRAPEITLPNMQDSMISLSSFRGKVVLLDFWASWCGPCRRSNPKLIKLYNKFKSQGFEIVAVSLDKGKMSWLDAVKDDKLPYTQMIDSRSGDSSVASAYGIFQIPTQFLIDKDGRLQEKDLEGKKLELAIGKLLKE